jgi:hypothetical protein
MHQNATSAIKWEGKISEQFPVIQGVCLGGILSADLCKLYINPLLVRLENSHIGSRIGNVLCNASACADDIALMSRTDSDMQIQINMGQDFAGMEGYKLQPKRSVSIHIRPVKTRTLDKVPFMLGTEEMPIVENATHLGIIRTGSLKQNVTQNVEENIKKLDEVRMLY